MGMNIERFIHTFKIGNEEIKLSIEYCADGYCEARSLAKDWAQSGGSHSRSREEYIKEVEHDYTYQYNFFKHGYKYAKANL